MHSSAFGATARMVLRSFSSAARLSSVKAARYSSMVEGLPALVRVVVAESDRLDRFGFIGLGFIGCLLPYTEWHANKRTIGSAQHPARRGRNPSRSRTPIASMDRFLSSWP